jgi:SAM-dependent methyltransferase
VYTETADLYDLAYSWKDYPAETERLRALVGREGGTLLDVACGTGRHLELLAAHYRAEGVDLDPAMVAQARARGLTASEGDLLTLDLGRRYDVVACLFSSIGYVPDLAGAIARLAAHVAPGGVLAVEPWLAPDGIYPGRVTLVTAESDAVRLARMSTIHVDGRRSLTEFQYLVGRSGTIEHLTERHQLWLWTVDEYAAAFAAAGLDAAHDEQGLMGRGLWLGTAPPP